MGGKRAGFVVLDAGALIAFERNERRFGPWSSWRRRTAWIYTPPLGLSARSGVAEGVRHDLRASCLVVQIHALDRDEAQAAGVLCGKSTTHDVIDASVALLARRYSAKVVTSDPGDLTRIDATLSIVAC